MRRHALRGFALIFALALAAAPLAAQTASLVKDINPLAGSGGSSPRWLHAVGGKVFFNAFEASSGSELWVTDGTGLGTELLVDACPGGCSAQPFPLGHVGGILFWTTRSFNDGLQLWRSDGTRAGTFSLTPAGSGVGLDSHQDGLIYALSEHGIFFAGCTAEAGCELWASDGSREGTRLVKDLTPGAGGSYLDLQAAGGRIFVTRHDFTFTQQAVWVTDGTAAGTVLLKDLGAGRLDNLTAGGTAAGGHLFFLFRNPAEGIELWASDGTPAGTLQVTGFAAPAPFAEPVEGPALKASGRHVYFVADDSAHGPELWRSDGTAAGTGRLTDFDFATPFDTRIHLAFVEEAGDRVVFIATDGVTVPRLWTSRGSPDTVSSPPRARSASAGRSGGATARATALSRSHPVPAPPRSPPAGSSKRARCSSS